MDWINNNWAELLLGVVAIARIVARLTPSKRDDEVTARTEKVARRVVEMLAGSHEKNVIRRRL